MLLARTSSLFNVEALWRCWLLEGFHTHNRSITDCVTTKAVNQHLNVASTQINIHSIWCLVPYQSSCSYWQATGADNSLVRHESCQNISLSIGLWQCVFFFFECNFIGAKPSLTLTIRRNLTPNVKSWISLGLKTFSGPVMKTKP